MNPLFWFLVILGGIVLWVFLSFTFRIIGKLLNGIGSRTVEALEINDPEDDENTTDENGGNENE